MSTTKVPAGPQPAAPPGANGGPRGGGGGVRVWTAVVGGVAAGYVHTSVCVHVHACLAGED